MITKKKILNTFILVAFVTIGLITIYSNFDPIVRLLGIYDSETFTYADGRKVEVPKATFAQACDENKENCLEEPVLLLHGQIDEGTIKSLINLGKKNPEAIVNTVCLTGPGGSNITTARLMKLINDEKLNTCLAASYKIETEEAWISGDYCASACPLTFLIGTKRTIIGNGIKFGVHGSGQEWAKIKITRETNLFDEFIREEHHSLYEFSKTIPHGKIYYLSDSEAKKFNVLSEQEQDKRTANHFDIEKCSDSVLNYTCL